MNNKYSWNKTLKFSWGHIIAFLAIIFISYVCYMGDFYKNGGDFKASALKILIVDLSLLLAFIGVQILRGTDSQFNRSIILERILICLCPLVFLWTMMPYNHFWTVYNERNLIEKQFSTSIEKSKQMFIDYDEYANTRIENYEKTLNSIIQDKNSNPKLYAKCGFNSNNESIRKKNLLLALRLQLLSQNTDSIKNVANKWISDTNQGATVWNAFLIGNVNQIANAIETWNNTLIGYSDPVLSSEKSLSGNQVNSFATANGAIKEAANGLKSLTQIYRESNGIQIHTVSTSIVLFLMLLFPYFLQKRSTRANGLYYLIPNKKRNSHNRKRVRETYADDETSEVSPSKTRNDSDDVYNGTF